MGRKFKDVEDGGTFVILAVCEMQKLYGRRSTNVVYAFKYVDVDGDQSDYQYTPVRELLNSYWCQWLDNPVASGRTARAARRGDTATPAPTPITILEIPTATSSRPFRPSPLRPTRSSSRRKVLT